VRHADLERPPPGLQVAANGSITHLTQSWPPRAVPNLSNGIGGSSLMSNYDAKNGLIQWITNTLKGPGVGNDPTCWHITVAGTTCCF
jgi:hypothetical protein